MWPLVHFSLKMATSYLFLWPSIPCVSSLKTNVNPFLSYWIHKEISKAAAAA